MFRILLASFESGVTLLRKEEKKNMTNKKRSFSCLTTTLTPSMFK